MVRADPLSAVPSYAPPTVVSRKLHEWNVTWSGVTPLGFASAVAPGTSRNADNVSAVAPARMVRLDMDPLPECGGHPARQLGSAYRSRPGARHPGVSERLEKTSRSMSKTLAVVRRTCGTNHSNQEEKDNAAFHGIRADGRRHRHAAAGAVRRDGRAHRRTRGQGCVPRRRWSVRDR